VSGATPRPWALGDPTEHGRAIVPEVNEPALCLVIGFTGFYEDAALIVRAVNAHDDLVACLKRCAEMPAIAATSDLSASIRNALATAGAS
jgi:hypothetical protein